MERTQAEERLAAYEGRARAARVLGEKALTSVEDALEENTAVMGPNVAQDASSHSELYDIWMAEPTMHAQASKNFYEE